ncbi:MAG: hypothetical protein Q4C12_01625 [Clostridia bacterium]|nr:hypothetical protein [Clostridia bacterium]
MKNNRLLDQMLKMLPKHERVSYEAATARIDVIIDGSPKFYIRESGGVTFPANMLHDDLSRNLHDEIVLTRECVSEYLFAMDNASDLKAYDFNMPYKKILEYNGVVLGGLETKDGEYNFTTWNYVKGSLYHGHYYGKDYKKAKEDFVTRSGLVNENRLFTEKEMTAIYRSVSETLESGYELDDEQIKLLKDIRDKIEYAVPSLDETVCESNNQEYGQSL